MYLIQINKDKALKDKGAVKLGNQQLGMGRNTKSYGHTSAQEGFSKNWLVVHQFAKTCLSHQAGELIFLFQLMGKKKKKK